LSRALRFGDLPISLEYLSHEIVQIISIDVFGGLKPSASLTRLQRHFLAVSHGHTGSEVADSSSFRRKEAQAEKVGRGVFG